MIFVPKFNVIEVKDKISIFNNFYLFVLKTIYKLIKYS